MCPEQTQCSHQSSHFHSKLPVMSAVIFFSITDNEALTEAWATVGHKVEHLNRYLACRSQYKDQPSNNLLKKKYITLHQEISPKFHGIHQLLLAKVERMEKDYFQRHKKLSRGPIDKKITQQLNAVSHFLKLLKFPKA